MKEYFICFLFLFFLSCSHSIDKELEEALRLSGNNRIELEAVLNHYKDDSLKLKAAYYLIKNMPFHYSKEEHYVSLEGKKYRPDITLFSDKDQVKKYCDSLIHCGYRAEVCKVFDITSLDSAFLVNNIELAFSVWQKPWAKNVSFSDFCRYILPYRAQTEKISFLRKEIMERFISILDSAEVTTPLEACIVLNEHLKTVIRYQDTGFPFYPTIEETYYSGISQCDGICNLGTFIMRAVGIPISVDFTIWPKMDLGHSWCTVLDNGRFYSFGPGEEQPDVHAKSFSEIRKRRPTKVYRFRFDPVNYRRNVNDDGYKTFLKSPLLYDVTSEYLDKTTDINVSINESDNVLNKQSGQVYLCIYNYYEWKPVAIGCYSKDMYAFDNVVGDNIFIVADSPDGKDLRYLTAPFYVDLHGDIHKFIPKMQQGKISIFKKRKNKANIDHTLFYWDIIAKRFIQLSFKESTDTTQIYEQVPDNALLWFTIPERIINQRIFFIDNDSIRLY